MARKARRSVAVENDSSTESLTIFLAKDGMAKIADILKSPSGLKSFPIVDSEGPLGTLYIQARTARPPRWAKFFEEQVEPSAFGRISSAAAVLFVPIAGRVTLVTFGQGRHLLIPEALEDRFGRRVSLNSIDENRVRSLDKQNFDTVSRHTRVQSSKETRPFDLGIDIDQDLLHGITGSPKNEALGKMLSGVESLHAMVQVDLGALRKLLTEYVEQFGKDSYKQTFSWVDQVAEITDKEKQNELDELMLAKILAETFDRCWLAVPEPIDWKLVAGFRYRRGLRQPIIHDIGFDTFLKSVPESDSITLQLLRQREAHCVGADDVDIYSWPIYRCIYCEIDLNDSTYLLNAGRWYCVAKSFVKQVNDEIKRIPKYTQVLPEFKNETEAEYNERVAVSDSTTFALMDRKSISHGGGYSKVEFCDLYTKSKDLIHVKRYGGSDLLSHLFAQGTVSGELFVSDADFRKAVNALLPRSHKLSDSGPRPDTSKFTVVYAIVSREEGVSLTLPFFSRLKLRHAARLLHGFGYQVALAKIPIDETVAKTERYKSKK